MPVQTVPQFEDTALAFTPADPSVQVVWGVAPKLDFDAPDGEIFVFNDSGQMVLANEADTLEQLIVKSVVTERLVYTCYDQNFGSDFWALIGRDISDLAITTLAENFIRDALSQIDLILTLDQFATEIQGDTLYLQFRAVSVAGHNLQFAFTRVIK